MIDFKPVGAKIIELSASATAIAGVTVADAFHLNLWEKICTAIALFLISALVIIKRQKKVRTFEPNSKKFARFIAKWYSKSGKLSIYCNDLKWVKGDVNQGIRNALHEKAREKELILYVHETTDEVNELQKHGANIFKIPSQSPHKFSILADDGFVRIICRNKVIESENRTSEIIEFIDTSNSQDPYLIALAKDVLQITSKI